MHYGFSGTARAFRFGSNGRLASNAANIEICNKVQDDSWHRNEFPTAIHPVCRLPLTKR